LQVLTNNKGGGILLLAITNNKQGLFESDQPDVQNQSGPRGWRALSGEPAGDLWPGI